MMNEIEQKVIRAQGWRELLNHCAVRHQWEWCLYIGLCETASWTNRDSEHKMFRWSK